MTTDSIRLYTYTVIYSDKGLTTPYNLISAEPSGWSPEFADIKRPHVTVDDVGLVFFPSTIGPAAPDQSGGALHISQRPAASRAELDQSRDRVVPPDAIKRVRAGPVWSLAPVR